MNFASIEYILFLAVVWGLYAVLPRRGQNIILLAASYIFYAAWDWRFLGLIIGSTVIDFIVGQTVARATSERRRKAALAVSVCANLGLLGFFKYFNFFIESAGTLLESVGLGANESTLNIVLPVGISFYTFQTMSYTIDIYRRKLEPTRDVLDFALFVAFFPQLVAGPIERARHLLPILQAKRVMSMPMVRRGLFLILLGLMKKVAIADGLSPSVNAIFGTSSDVSAIDVTLATWAFAFQILCDFSAYTDIARGTSKLFGIDLMINFNAPFFSRSPSDFWRRWHISLSSWLRDYLYIPLGGNRGGPIFTYRNLMLTMVLGGLWHGAAWNFVLWGFYQGLLLCGFRLFADWRASRRRRSGGTSEPRSASGPWKWISIGLGTAIFFQLVCYGWLLFRAESLAQVADFSLIFVDPSAWSGISIPRPPLASLLGLAFLIPWEGITYATGRDHFYRRWHPFVQGILIGVIILLLAMGLNNEAGTFIYFQF